jgi:hypothetical protein
MKLKICLFVTALCFNLGLVIHKQNSKSLPRFNNFRLFSSLNENNNVHKNSQIAQLNAMAAKLRAEAAELEVRFYTFI